MEGGGVKSKMIVRTSLTQTREKNLPATIIGAQRPVLKTEWQQNPFPASSSSPRAWHSFLRVVVWCLEAF